jgi:hypothetical protein
MVNAPLASLYCQLVSRGRLWFNMSAMGTKPSVLVPLIIKPKMRVITTERALKQTNKQMEATANKHST